jgi:HSP20 family protein
MAGLVPFNKRRGNILSLGNNSFYNMLDDFFNDDFSPLRNLSRDTFKIDVEETETEYSVSAEIPGVNKEEISLDFNDGRLSISVARSEDINEEKKNYVHRERRQASMGRSIYLSDGVAGGIKAKLENGLLFVSVPKAEKVNTACKINIE